jgi:hypothetical protein
VTNRYITVTDISNGPHGGYVYGRTTWRVPMDFDNHEEKLFAEICANGTMTEIEAAECVRLLRK